MKSYVNPQSVQQYHIVQETPYGRQVVTKRVTTGIENAAKRLRRYMNNLQTVQQVIRVNDACYTLKFIGDNKEERVSCIYIQEAHTIGEEYTDGKV